MKARSQAVSMSFSLAGKRETCTSDFGVLFAFRFHENDIDNHTRRKHIAAEASESHAAHEYCGRRRSGRGVSGGSGEQDHTGAEVVS